MKNEIIEMAVEISNLEAIESLGHLLAYYKSDLEYIAKLKLFIIGKINAEDYLKCEKGFQEFINEFRVARNIQKERVKDLVSFIGDCSLINDSKAVDIFAEEIERKKLTHRDKTMTVLASKIFFLNQPDKIIPMDSLNKKSLGLKGNKYSDFKIRIDEFICTNSKPLLSYLGTIKDYLIKIEQSVNVEIDFEKYRINRFTDKYLWVKGRNQKNR